MWHRESLRHLFTVPGKIGLVMWVLTAPAHAQPAPSISGGVWFNHVFDDNNALDRRTGGETGDVALILYASDDG